MKVFTKGSVNLSTKFSRGIYAAGDLYGWPVKLVREFTKGTNQLAYLLKTENGDYVVLKIPDNAIRSFRESLAHALFHKRIPIPACWYVGEGFHLQEYCRGELLIEMTDSKQDLEGVWHELGELLSILHANVSVGAGPITENLRPSFDSYASLQAAYLPKRIERLAESGILNPRAAKEIPHLIRRASDILDREKTTYLHTDFTPNNILIQGGRVSAILDWADLSSGPAGQDLARALIECPLPHKGSFMTAYGETDPDLLAISTLVVSFSTASWYAVNGDADAAKRHVQALQYALTYCSAIL